MSSETPNQPRYEAFAPEERLTDAFVPRTNHEDPANPIIEGGWTAIGMHTDEHGTERVHVVRPATDEQGQPLLDSEGRPQHLTKRVERGRFTEVQEIGRRLLEGMGVAPDEGIIDHVPGVKRREGEAESAQENQSERQFWGDPRRVIGHPSNPTNGVRDIFAQQLAERERAHKRMEEDQ